MPEQGNRIAATIIICILLYSHSGNSQRQEIYPPLTKWYQDPLGLKPLELSGAFGFIWGTAGVAACLILTKKDSAFKQKVSIYQETGFSVGYKSPYTCVIQNEAGAMYNVRKWMALGLGLNSFHFKDKINNTWSIGIRPFARWYAHKTSKASIFFEYGAGPSYSFGRFPLAASEDNGRTGTRFNFTTKYGIGAEVSITKTLSMQAGARHFHLSNGNLAGIKRNPAHDSNGFFAGLVYTGVD